MTIIETVSCPARPVVPQAVRCPVLCARFTVLEAARSAHVPAHMALSMLPHTFERLDENTVTFTFTPTHSVSLPHRALYNVISMLPDVPRYPRSLDTGAASSPSAGLPIAMAAVARATVSSDAPTAVGVCVRA